MALKLLNRTDAWLENKPLGIRLKLGFVLPEQIAELRGFFRSSSDPYARIALFALREMATHLEVQGEQLNPSFIGANIDVTDPENGEFLGAAAALVVEALLLPDELKKKYSPEPSPSS